MRCFAFVIGVLVSAVASGGEVADVLQKLVGECQETAEAAPGNPESIEQTQPSFFVRADVNHANREYHDGDRLAISVLSEADAYLYVLYKQVDGKIYLIFPNCAQPENQVKARTEVSVPARNDTFRWVVEPPFGKETVKVIASRTPLQELADPAFRQERFNKVSQETVKGMRVELVDQEVTSWAEDTIELAILPRSEIPVSPTAEPQPEATRPTQERPPVARQARRSGVFFGVAEYEFNEERVSFFRRNKPEMKPEEIPKLNVECPDNNAQTLHNLLRQAGGLDDARVYVNQAATKENLKQAVTEWLPSVSQPGDTVIVFFCGHGDQITDDNGDEADKQDEFLLPYDFMGLSELEDLVQQQEAGTLDRRLTERVAAALDVARKANSPQGAVEALCRTTGVTDDLFGHWLQRLAGRQILVILETCHSGGFATQEKSLVPNDAFSFDFLDQELSRLKDIGQPETALLTASSKDQLAWAFSPQRGISVLTYYLKDAVAKKRGPLTIEQAHEHCRNGIRQFSVEVNRYRREHGMTVKEPQDPLLFNQSVRPVLLKP